LRLLLSLPLRWHAQLQADKEGDQEPKTAAEEASPPKMSFSREKVLEKPERLARTVKGRRIVIIV